MDVSQELVLRAYTLLRLLREDWGSSLIVAMGLGVQGAALAMAANVAGAACLSIEEQPELLKAAMRSGSCDFIVNTLDEALRAMKNEVRKAQPISVGLQGNPDQVLGELVERGVQPELVVDFTAERSGYRDAAQTLQRQGAMLVGFAPGPEDEGAIDAAGRLESFVRDQRWTLGSFSFGSAAALKEFDSRAEALLPEGDELRRHWLRSAGKIVQRQRPLTRVLCLTPEEDHLLRSEG